MYEYWATLMPRKNKRGGILDPIYDADTISIRVDVGFNDTNGLGPCRLYGINAPEIRPLKSRKEGTEARDFVRSLLRPLDKFKIETFPDYEQGKYGRYLINVYLPDGTCLNDLLVENGFAIAQEY